MSIDKFSVPQEELDRQNEYMNLVRTVISSRYSAVSPKAFVHTYGCQGNVADGERLLGMLEQMGYDFCESPEDQFFNSVWNYDFFDFSVP